MENHKPSVQYATMCNGEGESESSSTGNSVASISLKLLDSKLLDCCNCFDPLMPPVYQCKNGHAVCLACKSQLDKCPFCPVSVSFECNRFVEKILKSLRVTCKNSKYGCKDAVPHYKYWIHEKICRYMPCSCPFSCCNYIGSFKQLYDHWNGHHQGTDFVFSERKSFMLGQCERKKRLSYLREQKEGCLFVVNNDKVESIGNLITVICLDPLRRNGEFLCKFSVETKARKIFSSSLMERVENSEGIPNLKANFVVPVDFFSGPNFMDLDLKLFIHHIKGPRKCQLLQIQISCTVLSIYAFIF